MDKEITPKDLALVDAWYWAYYNQIRLQAEPFGLAGHEYLLGPMQSRTHKRVTIKGAQMGFSEAEILRSLHGMVHGIYVKGVLYLFPTDDDVSEFSKGRFKPLILNNPYHIGRHIRDTDAVNIKQINDAMLFLHGARSTQKVGGFKKESSKLKSRSVDKLVFDELDLMDEAMIPLALERFSHSDVKEEAYLSTPTIPDYGIDKLYHESDQRLWIINCESCGRDCCLEIDFPECVKFKGGTAYRACTKCGAELRPSDGEWVAQFPSVQDFEGYWISQLNSLYVDPGLILNLHENPPNGDPQEVYNSKLAMAYIAAENRLTVQDVYQCCGTHIIAASDAGPCAMGVDVGKMLHVVIGKKPAGMGRRKIVWVGEVKEFEDLVELGKRFGVVQAAIDYEPETRKAREFQKHAGFPVYLCDERDKVKEGETTDEMVQVIKVARTEACDGTSYAIRRGELMLPRRCPQIEQYAKQMSNMAKILEEDERRGTKIYRYRKLGIDHFYHATNFFELAAKTIPECMDEAQARMVKQFYGDTRQDDYGLIYNPLTFGLS